MKDVLKSLASTVSVDKYHRALAHAIQKQTFPELQTVPLFEDRPSIWTHFLAEFIGFDRQITYVEFGVYEGASIRYFSEHNHHPDSRFFGCDSFEGLPTDWVDLPKGAFSTNGQIPDISDDRVKFIKGWFQDSWPKLASHLNGLGENGQLIVNYDADLYSSTLFALTQIDALKQDYYAIFDEFTGDETRALYDYAKAFGVSVQFISKTFHQGFPFQVVCKLTHNHR